MWTEEGERQLIEAHMTFGKRWAEIARHMPGRSENSIKNHWNATKRKMNAKKNRRRNPDNGGRCPPSVLQDYIESKSTLDFNKTCNTKTTPSSTSTQFSTGRMEERLLHTRSAGGLQGGETHGSLMHGSALNRLACNECQCMPTPCISGGCYLPTAHSCSNNFSDSNRSTRLHSRHCPSASSTNLLGTDNTSELLKAQVSSTSRNRDLDLVEMLSQQFSSSSQSTSSHSALLVANSKCF
ncbi:Myb-like DNA-binding domain [Musa troglodytarum]|uniref:Myb-like DNA-binding domain n=1 Tax=Musa troglodytarum TaxID=320322 RepID=A0A9E7HK88_9LILI|nr:Myb-like DNA-binding domain [Musa troglodytarum]